MAQALRETHRHEIDARVCEIVDLLMAPAGEFAPRVRLVLRALVDAVERTGFEDEDTPVYTPSAAGGFVRLPPIPPDAHKR